MLAPRQRLSLQPLPQPSDIISSPNPQTNLTTTRVSAGAVKSGSIPQDLAIDQSDRFLGPTRLIRFLPPTFLSSDARAVFNPEPRAMVVVLVCGSLTYYVIRHVQLQLSVTVCNCIECDYTILATVYCCESPSVSLSTSDCSRSLPPPCLFLTIKTHNFLSLFRLMKLSLPTLCLSFVSCSFHFLYLPNSLSVHQVSTRITIIVRKVRIQVHKKIQMHENTDTGPNARTRLCRVIRAGSNRD